MSMFNLPLRTQEEEMIDIKIYKEGYSSLTSVLKNLSTLPHYYSA